MEVGNRSDEGVERCGKEVEGEFWPEEREDGCVEVDWTGTVSAYQLEQRMDLRHGKKGQCDITSVRNEIGHLSTAPLSIVMRYLHIAAVSVSRRARWFLTSLPIVIL